jgi:hypothetical protein
MAVRVARRRMAPAGDAGRVDGVAVNMTGILGTVPMSRQWVTRAASGQRMAVAMWSLGTDMTVGRLWMAVPQSGRGRPCRRTPWMTVGRPRGAGGRPPRCRRRHGHAREQDRNTCEHQGRSDQSHESLLAAEQP